MTPLIPAEVHVVSDGGVSKLGIHRFQALPKIGETLMIGEDPTELWLTVTKVTHVPVPESNDGWAGHIVLSCEFETI